ncbi:hypothetical protein KGP36_02275 [Patescibacteria group bacterium]|nr:hypothetical protein [Patescibacteria group bacterium]
MDSPVITSDMPGTEQFAGMSEEELANQLPAQGQAPRDGGGSQPTTQQDADGGATGGGTAGKPASKSLDPQPGDTSKILMEKITAMETAMQNMNRENLAYRALQSKIDKLEAALASKPASTAKADDPDAKMQEEAAKFVEEIAKKVQTDGLQQFEQRYAPVIRELNRQSIFANLQKACATANIPWSEMDDIIGGLIDADRKAALSGDMMAKERVDRLLERGDISDVMLRAVLARSSQVQSKGAAVAQQQRAAAGKGDRLTSGSNATSTGKPANGKKPLDQMTQDEIDDLDLDELGKMLPRQAR